MEIIFCKQCGRRIKQDEQKDNQFTLLDGAHFCTTCMPITQYVPPPTPALEADSGGEVRRKSSAIMRPKTTSQSAVLRGKTGKISAVDSPRPSSAHAMPAFKPKPESKPPVLVYAGVAIGVLALLALILVFSMGDAPPVAPPKTPPDLGRKDPPPGSGGPQVPVPGPGTTGVTPPVIQPPLAVDSAALAMLFKSDIQNAMRDSLQGPRPRLSAPVVAAPPVVDGDLADACWASAAVFDNFTQDGTLKPAAESREAATVRIVQSGGLLYIAGEAEIPEGTDNMAAAHTNRDDSLWNEESFEIFLTPPTGKLRYAQLIVNPRGAVSDALARLGEPRDDKTNFASLKTAAKIAPNKWSFELVVNPADFFGVPGGRWMININHNRVAKGGGHKFFSWKQVGGDYHAWPQHEPIDFASATPAQMDSVETQLVKTLPEYTALRAAATAEKNRPLPFDLLDITPRPRTVQLPICPAFSLQDLGAIADAPIGSAGYFATSMSLRPDASEVGLLRLGALTAGATAHLRMTARLNGGNTELPRVLGLVFRNAPDAPPKVGLIGLMIVDGQLCGFSQTKSGGAGGPAAISHAGLVPLVVQSSAGKPVDLDFALEPDRVRAFCNGRLVAELPWPTPAKPAADLLGIFVQNSGLEMYKLLITPGLVDKTVELPPYGRVATAPDLFNATAASTGLDLYSDASAASGLCLSTRGKPIAVEGDFAANPSVEFKLPVHAGLPYRVFARVRNAGGPASAPPKFWLQAGGLSDPAMAAFAPNLATAFQFQRATAGSTDWSWVVLTHPQTLKPAVLVFAQDTDAPFRLIAATTDAAIDQIVLLPSEQAIRGTENNDDTCYAGGQIPVGFNFKSLQKTALPDAAKVRALAFKVVEEAPSVPPTGPIVPPPVVPPGTPVQSADGFITQVSLSTMRMVKARDGMVGFSELTDGKLTLPPLLINTHFGVASHADWNVAGGASFQFVLAGDAMVFFAYDPAVPASKAMLDELLTDGFERSTLLIQQSQPPVVYQVLRKRYPAGLVRFFHNLAGAPPLMFVLPADTTPRVPVDLTTATLPVAPGLPTDAYAVQLRADEKESVKDLKGTVKGIFHKVDFVPATALNKPAWAFYGLPASAPRNATDADCSYITLEDNPAFSRKEGAVSFWVYLGGNSATVHTIFARKAGTQVKTLEILRGVIASNFGAQVCRAKTVIAPYKWTLVVWNFSATSQQFIIDGQVEEPLNVPADLSVAGEIRLGNDYKKNGLEGFLAEVSIHTRILENAKPPADIPPALKLDNAMQKVAEPGAVLIYGFDTTALPREADLSGNGLDGAWEKYKGAVVTGQAMPGSTDRVASIKRGIKENPFLTAPPAPSLYLPTGSLFTVINLDKTVLKKTVSDSNRAFLLEQSVGTRINSLYFGDTMSDGFFFSVMQTKEGVVAGMVKSKSDLEGGITYKIAFTWTPQKLRLYQNGVMVDEKPNTGFLLDGRSKSLIFFGREGEATRGFTGTVSQIKLFNYARSLWE